MGELNMETAGTETLIWTGSYTADRNGNGEGIGALTLDTDGKLTSLGLAVAANSPSFISVHPTPPVLYAVAGEGKMVRAYPRPGTVELEQMGEPWLAGEAACHVATDPQGRFIVVAFWGEGQGILYELAHGGAIPSRTSAEAAVDPHQTGPTDEPRPSRAHSSLM